MHPLLQPYVHQLRLIDSILQSLPKDLPEPNVYPDISSDYHIEWYQDPDHLVVITVNLTAAHWYTVNGLGAKGFNEQDSPLIIGQPFPEVLTTAIKALEVDDGSQG
jgi:hypothetical protein